MYRYMKMSQEQISYCFMSEPFKIILISFHLSLASKMINSQRDFGLIKTSKVHIENTKDSKYSHLLYSLSPLSITAVRSSVFNFPRGFPVEGRGAPAATAGPPSSWRAPQVTK